MSTSRLLEGRCQSSSGSKRRPSVGVEIKFKNNKGPGEWCSCPVWNQKSTTNPFSFPEPNHGVSETQPNETKLSQHSFQIHQILTLRHTPQCLVTTHKAPFCVCRWHTAKIHGNTWLKFEFVTPQKNVSLTISKMWRIKKIGKYIKSVSKLWKNEQHSLLWHTRVVSAEGADVEIGLPRSDRLES